MRFGISFNNGRGIASRMSYHEFAFFSELDPFRKLYLSFFIFKRLLLKKSLTGLAIFFKGALNRLISLGRITEGKILDDNESNRFWAELLGFPPKGFELDIGNKKIKFAGLSEHNLWSVATHIYQIFLVDNYDIGKTSVKNRVVVDAGANVGFFSVQAALAGAKKVYAFEPVKDTYGMLVDTIRLNHLEKVIIPLNMALGELSGTATIGYSHAGDTQASMFLRKNFMKKEQIRIVSLDGYLGRDARVDFIKIDAEGAERGILLGGKHLIRKNRPVLSFSAYHRPEDRHVLPEVVKSIRKDYRCKIVKKYDEDFYCD